MDAGTGRYARLGFSGGDSPPDPRSPVPSGFRDVENSQVVVPPPLAESMRMAEQTRTKPPPTYLGFPLWFIVVAATAAALIGFGLMLLVIFLAVDDPTRQNGISMATPPPPALQAAVGGLPYRTAFHFQPERNWMNDPNGPMFFNGIYHLFYQYNPTAAVWGKISWGHAVSTDLIHWSYLPLALEPDQWYDSMGVWSGSATLLGEVPVLAYTGDSNTSAQLQNLAFPADLSDPYLREWKKAEYNPIATPPFGVNKTDFRDPTTAWQGADGVWRILLGARRHGVEMSLVYRTTDFRNWTLHENPLRTAAARTGMWECPDFFPVSTVGQFGLDTSRNGLGIKHVLKASFDDSRNDYYSVGNYNEANDTWTPLDPALDAETGLRYDYGRYYASKTFYDPMEQRRILLGWVNESDSQQDDIRKGWASVQAIPRTLWLDPNSETHLIQLPIDEVTRLRRSHVAVSDLQLNPGAIVGVAGANGSQLDIEVSFVLPKPNATVTQEAENLLSSGALNSELCSSRGAAQNGAVGPFGIAVLASSDLQELTPIYFEMVPTGAGTWGIRVCSDQSRSAVDADDRSVYGYSIRVLPSDTSLTLRVLVDHSIIETFAQGGQTVMTARVYPTKAIGTDAQLFLFNNGSMPVTVTTAHAWQMATLTFNYI